MKTTQSFLVKLVFDMTQYLVWNHDNLSLTFRYDFGNEYGHGLVYLIN